MKTRAVTIREIRTGDLILAHGLTLRATEDARRCNHHINGGPGGDVYAVKTEVVALGDDEYANKWIGGWAKADGYWTLQGNDWNTQALIEPERSTHQHVVACKVVDGFCPAP